jgi:serine/threonine-protein kinase
VVVPVVKGKTVEEATRALERAGFKADADNVANTDVPLGIVFDSDPKAGDKAKHGSRVKLKVSSGPPTITIPNVVGQPADDVVTFLRNFGLTVATTQAPSEDVAEGRIISQDPPANSKAHPGDTVRLTISSGAPDVRVPDVTGLDATEAANRLGQAGFRTRSQQEASSDVDEGKVIRSDPSAGVLVARGSTVTIVVSSGPAPVAVPDVTGQTENDARSRLEQDGFRVEVQSEDTTDPAEDGVVIGQVPRAGTQAPPGSTVTISVGNLVP